MTTISIFLLVLEYRRRTFHRSLTTCPGCSRSSDVIVMLLFWSVESRAPSKLIGVPRGLQRNGWLVKKNRCGRLRYHQGRPLSLQGWRVADDWYFGRFWSMVWEKWFFLWKFLQDVRLWSDLNTPWHYWLGRIFVKIGKWSIVFGRDRFFSWLFRRCEVGRSKWIRFGSGCNAKDRSGIFKVMSRGYSNVTTGNRRKCPRETGPIAEKTLARCGYSKNINNFFLGILSFVTKTTFDRYYVLNLANVIATVDKKKFRNTIINK